MSTRTHPSSVGCTTASWLATTTSELEWVKPMTHAGTATTSHAST